MSTNLIIPTGKRLLVPAVLFTEDFESPVISGYVEGQLPDNGNWLGADTGFGAGRFGMINKDGGDWVTAQVGNEQALGMLYTNSGACTADGVIGDINVNTVKYQLTVDIGYNRHISAFGYGEAGGIYEVHLCALPALFDRQDFAAGASAFNPYVIITLSGTVTDTGELQTFVGTYETDPVTDAALVGNDLAVVIDGATGYGVVDNVKLERIG